MHGMLLNINVIFPKICEIHSTVNTQIFEMLLLSNFQLYAQVNVVIMHNNVSKLLMREIKFCGNAQISNLYIVF